MQLENRWIVTALLLSLASALAGCDEAGDGGFGRHGRYGWDDDRDRDRWDRDGRRRWHAGRDRDRDAAADGGDNLATDAGDAGSATNADPIDAAAPTPGDTLDAATDAATPSGVAALSDAQILLVADSVLAGTIGQAQAAEPNLADPDATAAAQQLIDENAAARNTLASVASAIGATPAPSAIADEVTTFSDSRIASLSGPDAGALDALYLTSMLTAHAEALVLSAQLIAAADDPALRAQLVVIQTLLGAQRARAQQVADTL